MPLDVSALAAEIKPLDIPLGGGTLSVEYYPGRLTRQTDRLLRDKAKEFDKQQKAKEAKAGKKKPESETDPDEEAEFSATAEMLVVVLHSWDLVNGGEAVPLSTDSVLTYLGYVNAARILRALYADRDLPTEAK